MPDDQRISVSVKAAVLKAKDVMLLEYDSPDRHYNLPGGRLVCGESLREAVVRKIREETCAEAEVDRLLFALEYIPERWDFEFGDYQKVQMTFLAHLSEASPEPQMPDDAEPIQTGVLWVPLAELHTYYLLPRVARELQVAIAHEPPLDPLRDRW